MAPRVYLFLEEKEFVLEAWENANLEIKRCVDNHQLTVYPGHNSNHADIEIKCENIELTLKFSLRDLWQEKSLMLTSINQSVVYDINDENFDYWDTIPPFGVVELFGIDFNRGKETTEAEVEAFCLLLNHFLLKHFMMYVFLEREIQLVLPNILNLNSNLKEFSHNGVKGYRVANFG
ncbi:MAG: hypothetical protein NAG76_02400 [Candidatus Pristimantibacillus lignocellulolyticus]|uniref:Uncharacterized protein n=1 Tax=Candidatus Pristimantibacillus lignocellulolyticus TaxID=2994561 RepID=A0A9J6ZHC0_9BACL|nr:MAG: hypothetical protein NAG76_02400 [Candidatus Pristimantibacillus lignocellulolyticus]